MTSRAETVTGFDVSPGMLAIARARHGRATYVDKIPDQKFDWINAYIVFQHIPPERGLKMLDELLLKLVPRGLLSLHFTLWRDLRLQAHRPSLWARLRRFQPPVGEIQMYDYDLNAVLERLASSDMAAVAMRLTNHVGHHGAMIFAQRGPPASYRY